MSGFGRLSGPVLVSSGSKYNVLNLQKQFLCSETPGSARFMYNMQMLSCAAERTPGRSICSSEQRDEAGKKDEKRIETR